MEDEAARVVEVVVVRDGLADVPVLLGRSRGLELLDLEALVDDRLEEVERPQRVRHEGLVRPVPRLVDVGLRAEMEDVWPVGRPEQVLPDEQVDRVLVGEVGEVHLQPAAQVRDVAERAARGGADESVDVRAQLDERVREVRADEPVGAGHEHRPPFVRVADLAAELVDRVPCPEAVGRHGCVRFRVGGQAYRLVRSGLPCERRADGGLSAHRLRDRSGDRGRDRAGVRPLGGDGWAARRVRRLSRPLGRGAGDPVHGASHACASAGRGAARGGARRARGRARRRLRAGAPRRAARGRLACGAAHRRRVGGRAGRRRLRAPLGGPRRDRAALRRPRRERARGARRLWHGCSRLRGRKHRGTHAHPDPRGARRDRGRLLGRRPEQRRRRARSDGCARRAGGACAHARVRSPAVRRTTADAPHDLRRRCSAAALPPGPLPRVPGVRLEARHGRRDELRVRLCRRYCTRRGDGGVVGDRHVGAALARGRRHPRGGDPRRRDLVARPRPRRRRGRRVRARGSGGDRGCPRRRVRRRHRR